MSVDQASNFLISSILFSLGVIILIVAITAINNILSKFWKPVKMTYYMPGFELNPYQEYKIEPHDLTANNVAVITTTVTNVK